MRTAEFTMDRYIRFQTNLRCPDVVGPAGIFRAAHEFLRTKKHAEYVHQIVQESFDWFNENLQVPRLRERHWRAVFWFRSESCELLTRAWPLVNLLTALDIHVHKIRTQTPGRIIYSDRFQIAAIDHRYCR
jgi:hypothetical protein